MDKNISPPHIMTTLPLTASFKMALYILRTCLLLVPRLTSTNIRALVAHLIVHLSGTPSKKSPKHGFSSMVQKVEVYALKDVDPWVDYINPGPMRRGTNGTIMTIQ